MKTLNGILAVAVLCFATLLACEGLYAILRWSNFDGSLTYKSYNLVRKWASGDADTHKSKAFKPKHGPPFTWLLRRDEIDPLVPKLKSAGIALGNSPYHELETKHAAINEKDDGCLVQKPNIDKSMTYLRSNFSNPLDPLNMFYDSHINLDPEIKKIVDLYGLRLIRFTTNEYGERTTVPAVTSHQKIVIAGDSVANGVGIDDSETISSQLQALDLKSQYINLGIGGAQATDIICALKRAAQRYPGQMQELIYVYCENDFLPREPYGNPQEVVAWLRDFVREQDIAKVTVVYAPYIYNVVPQYTRFRGYVGEHKPTFAAERAALAELVREAGFQYVDIADLALEEAHRAKTQFAALSVFSDHVHLSPYGTARLVERLRKGSADFGPPSAGN